MLTSLVLIRCCWARWPTRPIADIAKRRSRHNKSGFSFRSLWPRNPELLDVLEDDEIVLLDGYHAGTYGIPDAQTLDAMKLAARMDGMITDPVYEGKSMAGLIDLIRKGIIAKGSRVLYAHLGGQPALNAYSALFR